MRHLKHAMRYYYHSLHHRRQWSNAWFRVFMLGVFGFLMLFVWDFFDKSYGSSVALGGKVVVLSQLLFSWFFMGLVLGVALVVAIAEGELMLGFRKIARGVGAEVDALADKGTGRKTKGRRVR